MSTYNKTNEEIQEELVIIEKARKDPDFFEVLYDKYYREIFLFIFKRTSNQDITADITSAVFLKAMVKIKDYVFKGVPFSAWLYRIAINEVNFYFRKTNAKRMITIEKSGISNMMTEFGDSDEDDNYQLMLEALKELSPEMMQLVELRFFEGRSFKDIGMIIGITENNAKVKIYRIIDRLKVIITKKLKQI